MITQWYDIVAVIGATYIGISAMLVLVVYLEQWLARPDPSTLASAEDRELDRPGPPRDPHTQIAPGLKQLVTLTCVTFPDWDGRS